MESDAPPDILRPGAARGRIRLVAVWAFGVVLLGALVAVVLHLGELQHFAEIARSARPGWLVIAVGAQAGTYACAAAVWWSALRVCGTSTSFLGLVPLSVAKLFTDQAVPTGGLSGSMLVIGGLRRRGVPAPLALEVLLVTLVSYYAAYLATVVGSLAILWVHHHASPALWVTTAVFGVVAVGLPAAALWLRRRSKGLPDWLARRSSSLARLVAELSGAPTELLRHRGLMAKATALQLGVFLLDVVTLWVVFQAFGQPTAFWIAFAAFVTGSIAATLGPVPLGLGTFEAATVAMLTLLGVPVEAALAATLLLRGLTFWLPMLPGLWLARREIHGTASG